MNALAPHLVALLLFTIPVAAQDWQAIYISRGGSESGAVGVDAAGNIYVTGHFSGTTTFGSVTLTSLGGADVYLVKYSPEGEVLWARSGGGDFPDKGYGVAVDAAGNAYVVGTFGISVGGVHTATFGPYTLTSAGCQDAFIVKYSPEGEVLWARDGGGYYCDSGYSIDVDAAGNVYVSGTFSGTAYFDAHTLTSTAGTMDAFLAKYAPDGEVLWVRGGGGIEWDEGYGVAVDAAGDVYVAGAFTEHAAFGTVQVNGYGDGKYDAFLVKYSSEGEALWGQAYGYYLSNDFAVSATVDGAGNVFITGTERAWLLTGDDGDAFLAKYSPAGDRLWYRSGIVTGSGPYGLEAHDVAVDGAGDAYVTGYFWEMAEFGPFTLTSAGRKDFFLVKYAATGEELWALSGGGARHDVGNGVTVDAAGHVYVTGTVQATVAFGTCTLTAHRNSDTFLARSGAPPAVAVTATPASLPVVIPPGGGTFSFAVTLTNPTSEAQTFEAWTAVTGLVSRDLVLGPRIVTLTPGTTVTQTLTQAVPGNAPPGTYTYHVRAGIAPCGGGASDDFTFEKAAGALAAPEVDSMDGWAASEWGEATASIEASAAGSLPGGYALSTPHPNPSDGAARLTLNVAEAQHVAAAVYDGLGRRIAVLLDGAVEAGTHALVFDGSSLPTGVYLVRVTGETFAASRRLTLVR